MKFRISRPAKSLEHVPVVEVVIGVPVRLHDLHGDDLGVVHLPPPIEPGDLVALEHGEFRVYDIVDTGRTDPIAALVKVRPAHLRPLVNR